MKFFIDTADIEQIKKLKKHFPIDGVTTNPSLIAQTKEKIENIIPRICDLVQGPVSAEVIETDEEPMFKEALKLAKLHKNVVVKIPITTQGLCVVRKLKKENILVNVTLCFSPLQALLAAQAGASMVSIFVGRIDDIEQSGMQVVSDAIDIYDNYSIKTEILAASIRHQQHVLDAALVGADIVTAPFKLLNGLIQHPLTDLGLKQFLEAFQKNK